MSTSGTPLSTDAQNGNAAIDNILSSTEVPKKLPKKAFTPEEVTATENLKRLWSEYRVRYITEHGEAITQAKAASKMGWTQSNFSQYLNGIVPVGIKAAQKISVLFGCKMSDIHEDYRDSEAVAEKERLKSMLSEILTVLSQLSRGETDATTAHRTAQHIVGNSGYADVAPAAI